MFCPQWPRLSGIRYKMYKSNTAHVLCRLGMGLTLGYTELHLRGFC